MAVPSHSCNPWALPPGRASSHARKTGRVARKTDGARNEAKANLSGDRVPPFRNTKRRRLTIFYVRSMEFREETGLACDDLLPVAAH